MKQFIPKFQNPSGKMGSWQQSTPLSYEQTIQFLYGVENPNFKNIEGNYARNYNDGTPTIGPGVAKTSNAPKEWFDGRKVLKSKVDNYAYQHISNDDSAIRKAYNKKYGTPAFKNPADTLSVGHRLYVAQNRYQRGSLGDGVNSILEALASGNFKNIDAAVANNTPSTDKDRMRRVRESYKNIQNNFSSEYQVGNINSSTLPNGKYTLK